MPKSISKDKRKTMIKYQLLELQLPINLVALINDIKIQTVRDWYRRWICHGNILSHSELYGNNKGRPSTITLCVFMYVFLLHVFIQIKFQYFFR